MYPSVIALALSPTVAMSQPITASGGFPQDTFEPTNFRPVGGVTMFDFTILLGGGIFVTGARRCGRSCRARTATTYWL